LTRHPTIALPQQQKYSVKNSKVTSNIATKGGPKHPAHFFGRAVGDGRSTLINPLVSRDGKRQR
jgi:hypothetical protein